jgi:NADH pyrophosphatase NudC (nudix superfamily)
MRRAVRAIIIKDDQILLIHRNKFGHEYDILVGGGIDIGETPEQALLREIQEEVGVSVSQPRLVFVERAGEPYGDQLIFICNYVDGEPRLNEDTPEFKIDQMGTNRYQPIWRRIDELQNLPIRSTSIKKAILDGIANGFPQSPIDITNS